MYKIKTLNDITIGTANGLLSKELGEYLKEYDQSLCLDLEDGEDLQCFNLEKYGYIAFLSPDDILQYPNDITLSANAGGLIGSTPEYVNLINLNNMYFHEIGILYDNDYMMIFFVEKGAHLIEIEAFLNDHV